MSSPPATPQGPDSEQVQFQSPTSGVVKALVNTRQVLGVVSFGRLAVLLVLLLFAFPSIAAGQNRPGSIIDFSFRSGLQTQEKGYKLRGPWKTDVLLGTDCSELVREFGVSLM